MRLTLRFVSVPFRDMPSPASRVHFRLPRSRVTFTAGLILGCCSPAAGQTSGDIGFPRGSGDRNSLLETEPRIVERYPVFIPPNPPPLDRPVARGVPAGGRFTAPEELSSYVTEFFYPALGTRLAMRGLPEKLRRQLDGYRTAKLALQNELRT